MNNWFSPDDVGLAILFGMLGLPLAYAFMMTAKANTLLEYEKRLDAAKMLYAAAKRRRDTRGMHHAINMMKDARHMVMRLKVQK